ncbi:bpX5 domain-containing protein [Aeromicrobium sp.]|uniref:bpX5 domain-containing protein n=1 Tax=Aeromicrobium sp. TaxID=1871063 RepID=UPI002FC630CC
MSAEPLGLDWHVREPPLSPCGVVARGEVVPLLAAAAARYVSAGNDLKVCHGDGWLVVLGDSNCLPWVDGVVYVGLEDGLHLPTTLRCSPPAGVVRRAVRPEPGPIREVIVLIGHDVLVGPAPARVADLQMLVELQ